MYSPVKQLSKEDQRKAIKEQKRQQLIVLLVNKFRNKFGVNNVTEPQADNLIRKEVQDLLQGEQMYEKRLNQLDKKLEVAIKCCREEIKNGTYNSN
jgi:parvulin-like peptidyl-prolyl isomerase